MPRRIQYERNAEVKRKGEYGLPKDKRIFEGRLARDSHVQCRHRRVETHRSWKTVLFGIGLPSGSSIKDSRDVRYVQEWPRESAARMLVPVRAIIELRHRLEALNVPGAANRDARIAGFKAKIMDMLESRRDDRKDSVTLGKQPNRIPRGWPRLGVQLHVNTSAKG